MARNVTQSLLELGTGFAFMGMQYCLGDERLRLQRRSGYDIDAVGAPVGPTPLAHDEREERRLWRLLLWVGR